MTKDWTGSGRGSIFKTLGASNHTEKERQEDDYYATEPKAIDVLLGVEQFSNDVWECACGEGHLSKRLTECGYSVTSSDLVNRGFSGHQTIDFLKATDKFSGDIITNPPYKYAYEFVEKGMELTKNKLALFLKIQFLEGKARKKLFEKYPPKFVYVSSSRLLCAKNGNFEEMIAGGGSAVAYAWFVWYKNHVGDTILKWIN
jgi:hypothetical protein